MSKFNIMNKLDITFLIMLCLKEYYFVAANDKNF